MILDLAQVFVVRPEALTKPDIDTYVGLMHTLFTLEDVYGLKIGEIEGELCLRLDRHNKSYPSMFSICSMFSNSKHRSNTMRNSPMRDIISGATITRQVSKRSSDRRYRQSAKRKRTNKK